MINYLSTFAYWSLSWGGWCIENENKESFTLSSQKLVCNQCVLISYCARSVRDAKKRDIGLRSQSYILQYLGFKLKLVSHIASLISGLEQRVGIYLS